MVGLSITNISNAVKPIDGPFSLNKNVFIWNIQKYSNNIMFAIFVLSSNVPIKRIYPLVAGPLCTS